MKFLAIAKKDILMYYMKGPVVIFGVLLPLFLFLAFWVGRQLPASFLLAGLISMTAFFSSTSVSPVIAPWEGQMKTLERLIACPVSTTTIVLGDIIASFAFGVAITAVPIAMAMVLGLPVNLILLIPALLISAFCFSCLALLFSAYPTDMPSTVMMISSLIRFPLVFISGIFSFPSDVLYRYSKDFDWFDVIFACLYGLCSFAWIFWYVFCASNQTSRKGVAE